MVIYTVCQKNNLGNEDDPNYFIWVPVSFHKSLESARRSCPDNADYTVRQQLIFD